MSIEELASIAEIVGGMVVIISLIYLARQVRENSLQAKLGSSIALNHLINEAFDPIYNSDRTIHIWTSGIANPTCLSKEEQAVFSLFMARLVVVFLTAITHNERDFLGSDVGRIHLGSLNSILSSPGGQFWQDEQGGNAFLDNRVRDILQSNAEYQDSLTLGSDD